MWKNEKYPQHLYEPIRIQIAKDYIKQDFRKILPKVRGQNIWQSIDREIDSWFESSSPVNGLRDFWNRFDGIAMGGKLKVGLLQVITAENIQWQLVEQLPLNEHLASGGGLGYMDPALDKRRLKASELREFAGEADHADAINQWRKVFAEQATTGESRDEFPIIVAEDEEDGESILSIHGGNRRMALAVLNGKTTTRAYVGRYTTPNKQPQNFWLPTSFLMELVKEAEMLSTEVAYQNTLALLRGYQSLSQSGKYKLLERVLTGSNPIRQKLKADLLKENAK